MNLNAATATKTPMIAAPTTPTSETESVIPVTSTVANAEPTVKTEVAATADKTPAIFLNLNMKKLQKNRLGKNSATWRRNPLTMVLNDVKKAKAQKASSFTF